MGKNCVFTIVVGDKYNELAKLTQPTIRAYADKIGADFVVQSPPPSDLSPYWERFHIYDLLNKYERILYLDADVIIRPDCPNLFDIVPEDKLGAFNEGGYIERNSAMVMGREQFKINPRKWDRAFYNTGVLVLSRKHKQLFKKPQEFFDCTSTYLNLRIAQEEIPMMNLPYIFNRMSILDAPTGEERLASYIVHYTGAPDISILMMLISNDLIRWQTNSAYTFKRHIWVNVQGGLGDQIDAEPSIRFMLKHIYPNEDVVITSHWPRLFKHITGAKVFGHDQWRPTNDPPYYHMCTLPGPDTPMWMYVSNLLSHTVDFCSMAMLRRILPDIDKQPKLEVLSEDIKEVTDIIGGDLSNLVLIHPGRHWTSKTFPTDWWQKIIDGLHATGQRVVILGKEADPTVGTVPVQCPEGAYDVRDLLSEGGLIALISKGMLLITNDSAPVHVAGAFDNYIILIPTCKHPDHILPYRNGNKYHKAFALYKELTISKIGSAPTLLQGSTADVVIGDIRDYLPEPGEVIEKAISLIGTAPKK